MQYPFAGRRTPETHNISEKGIGSVITCRYLFLLFFSQSTYFLMLISKMLSVFDGRM